jgi:hypothetical protein
MNGTHHLAYAEDVNVLGDNMGAIKKHINFNCCIMEVGLEVWAINKHFFHLTLEFPVLIRVHLPTVEVRVYIFNLNSGLT